MALLITAIVFGAVFFAATLAIMLVAIQWQSREHRLASERREAVRLAAAGAETWPTQKELDTALARFERAYSAEHQDARRRATERRQAQQLAAERRLVYRQVHPAHASRRRNHRTPVSA